MSIWIPPFIKIAKVSANKCLKTGWFVTFLGKIEMKFWATNGSKTRGKLLHLPLEPAGTLLIEFADLAISVAFYGTAAYFCFEVGFFMCVQNLTFKYITD